MMIRDFTPWPEVECRRFEQAGYWQPQTLGEWPQHWVDKYGDCTALVEGDHRLSYRQLALKVTHLAAGLHQLGIGSGDRVLVQLPNGVAFVAVCFALFRLGAIPILAMPAHRKNDIAALCTLAEPFAYIFKDHFLGFDYSALAREVAASQPTLAHLIVDGEGGADTALSAIEADGACAPSLLPPLPSHRDVALLLLSGGTTGTPKLIPRTHADYSYSARASAALCRLTPASVYLAALPVAHNFPLACPGVFGTLSVGGTVVLAHTPGPDECFALIARERVSFTALVPPLLQAWLEAREWDSADLSSLAFLQVGGARCEPALAAQVAPGFGCRTQQVFGMAEGLLCYTRLDDSDEVALHTQGRPLSPDDEIRIVDARGQDAGPGEVGELLTRGPYTLRGYYRAPEHNAGAFTADGFYRSGDLARMTPQGNLVVAGRIKEQIQRGGEKIAVPEVEQALCRHPEIRGAVLVAVPDERMGERSCAFLLAGERHFSVCEISAFLLREGLPQYKCPDQIAHIAAWPLTPIGKVDKQRLRVLAQRPAEETVEGASGALFEAARYMQREVAISTEPLVLAAAIAQAGWADDYAIYERHGEWSLGLGVAATVHADAAGVHVRHGDLQRTWPGAQPCENMGTALAAIGIEGWRAYGCADFELADAIYGIGAPSLDAPLLQLFIPRQEIRLRQGTALLRSLDGARLPDLADKLAALDRQCIHAPPVSGAGRSRLAAPVASHDAQRYLGQVSDALAEIRAGRYQKVILSRKVPVWGDVDLIASYLFGRRHNTPARSFVLQRTALTVVGFSPETVVEVNAAGEVSTQPLAGTRSRGTGPDDECRLRHELENDIKEIAEHAVSVRLAAQELASVCLPGSVVVSEFMTVRARGTVQHLASRVKAQLPAGCSAWSAMQALFPAVTASGIPKREAIDAIHRLEADGRGPYSGCILIADCDGSLDAALVLRSLYQRRQETWLQAGAGIVAHSTPERELEETIEKLNSVAQYLIAAALPAQLPAEARRDATLQEGC